jgi:hypothetical protein
MGEKTFIPFFLKKKKRKKRNLESGKFTTPSSSLRLLGPVFRSARYSVTNTALFDTIFCQPDDGKSSCVNGYKFK